MIHAGANQLGSKEPRFREVPPMTPPNDRPEILVVKQRPSRGPKGIALPLIAVLVAGAALIMRSTCSDWRGFSQEFQHRIAFLFTQKDKPLTLVTKAELPKPDEKKLKEKQPEEKTAATIAPSPWDDIQNSADKAKAEREEAEQIKAKAAEDLAMSPPPPTIRRGQPINPAQFAEIQRRRAEAIGQMQVRMEEHQRRVEDMFRRQGDPRNDFDQMVRRQAEVQRQFTQNFARMGQRGIRNVPPGFGNFAPPPPPPQPQPPGMNRDKDSLPVQPQIQEDSGEEVRDGVRFVWKRRTVIIGGR